MPARPEIKASTIINTLNAYNLSNRREDGRGDAFARCMRCRPATDQCLPKVNQTLRGVSTAEAMSMNEGGVAGEQLGPLHD